jgi:TonB family protein
MFKRFGVAFLIFLYGANISISTAQNESNSPPVLFSDTLSTINYSKDSTDQESDSGYTLDREPEMISFVKASYPQELLSKGIEGKVTLEMLVNEQGRVDSVRLIKSLHPELDQLAINAAKNFVFSPGIADSKPVPVNITYDYNYSLNEIVNEIIEQTTFSGVVKEKGSREPVSDAYVCIAIEDTTDTLKNDVTKTITIGTKIYPLKQVLEKIGSFKGQSLEDGKIVAVTDSLGRFAFKSIPPGEIFLKIIANGHMPFTDNLKLEPNEVIDSKYYIERTDLENQYEIIVYGKSEKKEITHRALQANEAKRVPGFSGDVVKAVQAFPGVARPSFGGTEIILRGADWEDNKYYIDGIEIPYLWHELGNNSVLNPNTIGNVNLFTSSFGTKYGNALGGVIEVESRKAREDHLHVIADISTSHSSLLLEMPITKKLSLIGAARREYFMSLVTFISENFYNTEMDITLYYLDYSLRLDYKPNENNTFFCEYLGAKDVLKTDMSDGYQGSIDNSKKFNLAVAGWDLKISNSLTNHLRYGISPVSQSSSNKNDDAALKYSISGYEHTCRDQLTLKLNNKVTATLGLDLHLEPTDIHFTYDGVYYPNFSVGRRDTTETKDIRFVDGSVGGYLSLKINPTDKLTITPEYRLDYYPGLAYHGSILPEFWEYDSHLFRWSIEPSMRISSRYSLTDAIAFKGSAGTYNQTPGFIANKVTGNPKLEPGRGAQVSLGYEWQIHDALSFDIMGYYNRQWDKARYVQEENSDGDDGDFLNEGKARMKGIEVFLKHSQNKIFSGWLSYSLAYSERYDPEKNKWAVFDRNILNNVQLVSSFKLRKNQTVGLRFQFTNGYPYTPAKRVLYYDASEFYYVPEWGERNSELYPPYFGLDIRYEKKIAFKHSIVTIYTGCDRILHALQFIKKDNGEPVYLPTEFPAYNYDYSEFWGFANFPSPEFGLSVEF